MYPTFQCLTLGACNLMSSGTCIIVCGFLSVVRVLLALELHCYISNVPLQLTNQIACTCISCMIAQVVVTALNRGKPRSLSLGSTCHQDAVQML